MIYFKFIGRLPDVEEANRRVKAIKDGEWHRDVRDDDLEE